ADSVTWVFTLRNDAKIAPNKYGVLERVIDATDVKASFDFIADKATASNGYPFFNTWVDKTEVVDPQTFRLITKKPYAFTEASLGNWLFCAIAPKEWIGKGSDQMKADSVGAGAFILKNLTESSVADMVPNPNYWDTGRPYLDQYSIKLFGDQATYRAAFQSKQIDSYGPSDKDEGEALKNAEKGVIHTSDPSLQYLTFWMNTRIKPWDDPRARRAVNMAIDRNEYVQIIGKGGGEPIGPLSYAFKNEALPQDVLAKLQPFDVAGAKTLFEQAGVKELPFSYPTLGNTADYVNIFVRQMQAAGVTAKATALDTGTWLAQYFASTINASLGLNQTYNTPNDALQWYHTGGYVGNGKYDTGFSDPQVDKAIDDAAGIPDPAARAKAYQDLQKLILSKDPALVNFFGTRSETVYRDFVQNYPVGLSSLASAMTKTIWLNK
ncbi:MAG: ABC transporter substrate-binding protein, partial [Tepidiformaceae bacterium]